jgi:putative ABC transport system permease protein
LIFTIILVAANTMAMSIRERTGEIAILKALGFSPGQVLEFDRDPLS